MINPMIVEGQIAGGVVQGIGGVLYEHFIYDEYGTPLTTTFLDYLVPDRDRGPGDRVRPRRDAVTDPGWPQGDGRGRRDRVAARGVQRGRRRARRCAAPRSPRSR